MTSNEALELGVTGKTRWRRAHALLLLIAITTLGGCVAASPSETSPGRIKGGDLVYNVCMDIHAGSAGPQMLPIVCRVMADNCKQNPGGDGCKGPLAKLDEKMKPRGTSMLFAAAHAGRSDIVKTMLDSGSDPNASLMTLVK